MNEVVILSASINEKSTYDVLDWLFMYNVEVTRINDNLKLDIVLAKNFINFELNKNNLSIWYRRGNGLIKCNDATNFSRFLDWDLEKISIYFENSK